MPRPPTRSRLARCLATGLSNFAPRSVQVVHAHQYTPFFYAALAKGMLFPRQPRLIFTEHGRHFPDIVFALGRITNRVAACTECARRRQQLAARSARKVSITWTASRCGGSK